MNSPHLRRFHAHRGVLQLSCVETCSDRYLLPPDRGTRSSARGARSDGRLRRAAGQAPATKREPRPSRSTDAVPAGSLRAGRIITVRRRTASAPLVIHRLGGRGADRRRWAQRERGRAVRARTAEPGYLRQMACRMARLRRCISLVLDIKVVMEQFAVRQCSPQAFMLQERNKPMWI